MRETCHQNCPSSVAVLWLQLQEPSTLSRKTCYQWLPPLTIRRVFRDWIQVISCPENVVVGLNGEFVHTAQLGANHLQGTQLRGKE